MKKTYKAPELDVMLVLTRDVITLSIVNPLDERWGVDNENGERVQAWQYE